ncbi:hypothetical protein ACLB2K_061711 [Fragaria x ananassa]
MALSSTYDLYLSFRGIDTRQGITSALYDALMRSGLKSFLDDIDLEIGFDIFPSLARAIHRKQKRSVGEALEKHHCSGRRYQTMLEWREALTQVANICGWDTRNHETDRELVFGIVKSIQCKGLPTRLNISIYPLRYDMCDEYLKMFLQAGRQEVDSRDLRTRPNGKDSYGQSYV